MTYGIDISNRASRELSRLEKKTRERIANKLDILAENPRFPNKNIGK